MSKVIPRFLYHLTSKANYQSIMTSGVLKTNIPDAIGDCICASELTNLFKRWRGDKYWEEGSLMERLIDYCAKETDELVMLKIPTKQLDVDKLTIRSQNRCFKADKIFQEKSKQRMFDRNKSMMEYYKSEMAKLPASISPEERTHLEQEIYKTSRSKHQYPNLDDLFEAFESVIKKSFPAKERKLFQQRKEAIEYIYSEDIPTSQIEKIGEVNVEELRKTAEYDPLRPIRSIFSALLRGTPQEKGALLLNC